MLLIDSDPQGNSSSGMGIDRSQITGSTYDLFTGKKQDKEANVVLLDVSPSRVYVAHSGLIGAPAGASFPTHRTPFTVQPGARVLDGQDKVEVKLVSESGGVRLTVLARNPDDAKVVARIRGLGFAGLLTEGAHHQAHHLAMAKGEALPGHAH